MVEAGNAFDLDSLSACFTVSNLMHQRRDVLPKHACWSFSLDQPKYVDSLPGLFGQTNSLDYHILVSCKRDFG